jgi:prepilin-type processing-associated H-X9-DG protein
VKTGGLGMLVAGRYVTLGNSDPAVMSTYTDTDIKNRGILACPACTPLEKFTGGITNRTTYLTDLRNGSASIIYYTPGVYTWNGAWGNLDKMSPDRAQVVCYSACEIVPHISGINVMYADGHVLPMGIKKYDYYLTMWTSTSWNGFQFIDSHDPNGKLGVNEP